VFVARHGVFLEKEFLAKRVSGSSVHLEEVQDEPQPSPNLEESQENLQSVAEPILETPAPRRSDRVHRPPDKLSLLVEKQGDASLSDNDDPVTFQEAMESPDSKKWLEAMRSEMNSMKDNQVWNLVDLPDGVKAIECKWIFKRKIDLDGNVHIHKARLVAKGFRQIHGVDYDEPFP